MSSSNALTLLNPSRLSTVHPFSISDNGGLGTQQTIMLYDNEGNAYLQNTNVQVNTGPSRDTGIDDIRNSFSQYGECFNIRDLRYCYSSKDLDYRLSPVLKRYTKKTILFHLF